METLGFILIATGMVLLKLIIVFIVAIPTGMGLGIGLYAVKKWFAKCEAKKLLDKHGKEVKEVEAEEAVAGGVTAAGATA
jgi:predicted Fe-Mo cluster-binding NifX family protein